MRRQADRILVVEDDASVRDAITEFLREAGYCVDGAHDAAEARKAFSARSYQLVVLDIMMPGEDGLSLCEHLADEGAPVLIVSALSSTAARIMGLETGAADYLPKPFDPRELLARVRAMLRRRFLPIADRPVRSVRFADLIFDPEGSTLQTVNGDIVSLTLGDLRLLAAFVGRSGRLLSRDTLLELTRSRTDEPFERAIDLAVSRLRRKLADAGAPDVIETVRGLGYRFRLATRDQ